MNLFLADTWLPAAGQLRLFSPELVLVGTIAAILVVPLFTGRNAYLAALLAMVGALLGLLATGSMALDVAEAGQSGMAPPGATPMLIADRFSVFFKMFILLLLVLVTWLWTVGASSRLSETPGRARFDGSPRRADAPGAIGSPEFFVLLLTSAVGMMLMVGTLNLLVMVVAMETASLPSYAMAASNKRSRLGAEAGLKYVMFGAAAAAIMVYGVSLLYGQFGTLDLGSIAEKLASASDAGVGHTQYGAVFWLALAAIGAGITFKIAAFPMHLWCPDVFEGAPVEVTTWLSVASKAAGLGLLLRFAGTLAAGLGGPEFGLQPLAWGIGIIAAITCTVGNLAALRQESVKRTLAYSSIAHAGYMMMAAAILVGPASGVGASGLNTGVAAVIAYLFVYIVMNVGAFGATALVAWQAGTDHLSAFTGLGRRAPWLALPLAVCLFSLVGLPPLGGFAAKWFLLLALGRSAAAQPWLWGLVIVAVINTAISLYYYVRIIRQMYLTDDANRPALRLPVGGLALVNACAVLLLLIGTLWFSPLGRRAEALASNLYEPIAGNVDRTPVAQITVGVSNP